MNALNYGSGDFRLRATLGRVVDGLGSILLEVVAGQIDRAQPIGGVVIYDPIDPPAMPPDALVLGVGLAGPESVSAVLKSVSSSGATALIVRSPAELDDQVVAAVEESGVVLLGLNRGASWSQIATLIQSLISVDDFEPDELGQVNDARLPGAVAGDLFALADSVSELICAPLTIEDLSSGIIAFSSNQDKADQARKEAILGRQVPEGDVGELVSQMFFRRLYTSNRPVFLPCNVTTQLPRVAIAVRAGDELLGSMWAVVTEPLSADRERAFIDSAKVVALYLLRRRSGADVGRRLRTELVATVLEGGPAAREAASRLGINRGPTCVLALTLVDAVEPSMAEAELQRVLGAFELHLMAVHPRAASAMIGEVIYGLIPLSGGFPVSDERAVAIAQGFLDRLGRLGRVIAGIGRVAMDTAELPRSLADADRALRVLRSSRADIRVVRAAEVQTASLLLELGDIVHATGRVPSGGSIDRLTTYDERHSTDMVETLRVWLDAFGDVGRAAADLHIHANTLRYRLRRVAEIGEMDLSDSEVRFTAMLELRLAALTGDQETSSE